ncbi:hypothetical protein CRU99_08890 [Malaciobacter mytili]|uniref:hypothetical protein n=1 Tax=Malaciobacter mytili TaxID=603050 RepID=UPI00100B1657|nr:hypothetical protein [Malaciobacter mytili]RXI42627.1 hypothetical protein CRU99_08890 [Malaciobacter mytili]
MHNEELEMIGSLKEKSMNIQDSVHQIIFFIHNKEDYESAAQVIIRHKISMSKLAKNTFKLTLLQFAKLADVVIKIKRGK